MPEAGTREAWLEEQAALERAVQKQPAAKSSPEKPGTSERSAPTEAQQPTIQTNNRHLRDITADALDALKQANTPPFLFRRGTVPVRVDTADKAEALTATSLKGILDRTADFVKVSSKQGANGEPVTEETPVRPPYDLAPDILALDTLPFPKLDAIASAPVALPGGTLLLEDGFNAEHGILLRLKGLKQLRSDLPIAEALNLLWDVFGDFPYAEPDAGFAHVLAMTLQPFVRPMINGPTPLYLPDAPARGSGKGLVVETASIITLGYPAPVMSQPGNGDELEKRITTALLEGRPFVFLDNVTSLKSPHLAAALTAEIWQGRILGKSELVSVPNRAVWLATGNNVEISDEFARRIIPIRLDAGVERPEDRRGFRHKNLPEYVRAHRSELVSACLSLVQAWINEGMPEGKATLGRFESWAGIIGGILEVSVVSGFLSGRERLYNDADSETKEWAALCEAWWSAYGERPISARDLFEIVKDYSLLLDLWGGRTNQGALQRIGHALSSRRDRVFGGFKVLPAGKDGVTRSAAYRLKRIGNKTTETTETTDDTLETLSGTQNGHQWFSGGFDPTSLKTTGKPPQNHRDENAVQHGTSAPSPVVSGVSVVLDRPAAKPKAPPEVWGLYRRFKAGDFADRPELENELKDLFSPTRADDAQKARLRELANQVQP